MFVVGGLRRSGTSMLMYALKQAGLEIAGHEFMVDDLKHKTDKVSRELNEKRRITIEANPNGYWELPYITTSTGLEEPLEGDVVKVMFEALSCSDPELIDKILVIFRNPRKNLYSMMNNNQVDYVHIFILKQIVDIIDTLEYLQGKPHKIVLYENILKRPNIEMTMICDFLGKGDWKKGANAIDKKLDRSKESKNYQYMDIWEKIYEHIKRSEIDKVIKMKPLIKNINIIK